MPKYRKKPVVIEAFRLPPKGDFNLDLFHKWCQDHGFEDFLHHGENLIIPTPEGDMIAQPGDWIIKGVEGEFYPCKPSVFDITYEPIDE